MTTPEAAARLNLSKRRILDFIRDGRIPAEKIGRDWHINPEDVEAFAALDRVPHRKRRQELQDVADIAFGRDLEGNKDKIV